MLQEDPVRQSSSPKQVIVQRKPAPMETHFASVGAATPHSVSSGVPVGAQFLFRNSFFAGQELTASVQISATSPSMLLAPDTSLK